ncbi:hypothetical protein FAZ19_09685 [Sphingobacterium alkalisoli]|uniref:Uncharacterized protein n=1 Tax=Sphingobacterium alkalisoli TaxID=1874115 RepID=A0A4U0H1F2_9SPHI|nr:hypothetical protein [Sphingobacterium alkalisoli]TJY65411.1 hypothetical protein FAZ19_09685 [Sphingobacterium alkalisoli]
MLVLSPVGDKERIRQIDSRQQSSPYFADQDSWLAEVKPRRHATRTPNGLYKANSPSGLREAAMNETREAFFTRNNRFNHK